MGFGRVRSEVESRMAVVWEINTMNHIFDRNRPPCPGWLFIGETESDDQSRVVHHVWCQVRRRSLSFSSGGLCMALRIWKGGEVASR